MFTKDLRKVNLPLHCQTARLPGTVPYFSFEPIIGGGGSSDVGNVSWIVPTTPFITACWPNGIYAHTWGNVAAVGHSIGFKGMRTTSRVIAASAIDTLLDPAIVKKAREEHKKKTGGVKYVSPIPKDRPPPIILDIRYPKV